MRRVLALILVSSGFFIAACSIELRHRHELDLVEHDWHVELERDHDVVRARPAAAAANATINVATNAKYGQILVDSEGKDRLHLRQATWARRRPAPSAACAAAWPAVVAAGTPQGGTGVTSSMLGTAQGQVAGQVTYNGHLLYRFAADTSARRREGRSDPELASRHSSGRGRKLISPKVDRRAVGARARRSATTCA